MPQRMYEKRKHWMKLVWKMAENRKSEYDSIMAMDILEFWHLFDMWLAGIKEANKQAENDKNKKHGR